MQNNTHIRDKNIQFFEEGHLYIVNRDPTTKYTSVTTLIKSLFPPFDADAAIENMRNGQKWNEFHACWGMTNQEIKDLWAQNRNHSAQLGTQLHKQIEYYYNHPEDVDFHPNTTEWGYFLQFVQDLVRDFPDKIPYRTEWCIYHEDLKISGSIDMVYKNKDGTVSLYDWKRAKEIKKYSYSRSYGLDPILHHIPDANFWHYSLQLNIYKMILEEKYGLIVKDMCLVVMHPNQPNYKLLPVSDMSALIKELFCTYC